MAPFLLLFFLFATLILVNLTGPQKTIGPKNYDREAEEAYKAAFEIVSGETVARRRLVRLLLVIALLVDILLLVWIVRFSY